jgi:hypothetical protein
VVAEGLTDTIALAYILRDTVCKRQSSSARVARTSHAPLTKAKKTLQQKQSTPTGLQSCATSVNRTRSSTLEGWNPNHWTNEAIYASISIFDIMHRKQTVLQLRGVTSHLWSTDHDARAFL